MAEKCLKSGKIYFVLFNPYRKPIGFRCNVNKCVKYLALDVGYPDNTVHQWIPVGERTVIRLRDKEKILFSAYISVYMYNHHHHLLLLPIRVLCT